MKINKYIDHTLLKATATNVDIIQLCKDAVAYNFTAVCVNGSHINLAKKELKNSDVLIATVVGFPLGASSTNAKICETQNYIRAGADEIDMVINIGWLKSGKFDLVKNEIQQIKSVLGDKVLKVIIETCYLTDEEKRIACRLVVESNADYVKTSTGFGTGGATLNDVKLIKDIVKDNCKIKASGGIRDYETAMKYIDLGADRIGTSSGINIVEGA